MKNQSKKEASSFARIMLVGFGVFMIWSGISLALKGVRPEGYFFLLVIGVAALAVEILGSWRDYKNKAKINKGR